MKICLTFLCLLLCFSSFAQKDKFNIEFIVNDKNLVRIAPRVYMSQSEVVNLRFRETKASKGAATALSVFNSADPDKKYKIYYSKAEDLYGVQIRIAEDEESTIAILPASGNKEVLFESITIFYVKEGFAPIMRGKAGLPDMSPFTIGMVIPEEENPTVFQDYIDLKFWVKPYDPNRVYLVTVFNGSNQTQVTAKEGFNGLFSAGVQLKNGNNPIIISVHSDSISGNSSLNIKYEVNDFSRKGRDYALLIAVQNYDQASLQGLSAPISDVEQLDYVLQTRFGFKTEVLRDPSLDQIKDKIRDYAAKTYKRHDQLMIFFSGHGIKDKVFSSGYFAARDSDLDHDFNHNTFYSYNEMQADISDIKCGKMLLMIDACYSGKFHRKEYKGIQGKNRKRDRKEEIFTEMEKKTRTVITSTGENKQALDGQFMEMFISALKQPTELGFVTLNHVMSRLEGMTPKPIRDEFSPQTAGADFYFILKKY